MQNPAAIAVADMVSSNAKTFMTYVDGIANGASLYDGAVFLDLTKEH